MMLFINYLASNYMFTLPKYINFGGARLYSFLRDHNFEIDYKEVLQGESFSVDIERYDTLLISLPFYQVVYDKNFIAFIKTLKDSYIRIIIGGMFEADTSVHISKMFKDLANIDVTILVGEGEDAILDILNKTYVSNNLKQNRNNGYYSTMLRPETYLQHDTVPVLVNNTCDYRKCRFCVYEYLKGEEEAFPVIGIGNTIDQIQIYIKNGIVNFFLVGVSISVSMLERIFSNMSTEKELHFYVYNSRIEDINRFISLRIKYPHCHIKYIVYAPETFSKSIFKTLNKSVDLKNINKLASYCKVTDIQLKINLIYGLSENDEKLFAGKFIRILKKFDNCLLQICFLFDASNSKSLLTRETCKNFIVQMTKLISRSRHKNLYVFFQTIDPMFNDIIHLLIKKGDLLYKNTVHRTISV